MYKLLFPLLALLSCSNRLSEKQTLDILTDFYLYDNLSNELPAGAVDSVSLPLSVFAQHAVSQEDFEATMRYYVAHPKKMRALYEKLQGAMEKRIIRYEKDMNVWKGEEQLKINKIQMPRKVAFHVPVDRLGTYHLKVDARLFADDSTSRPRMVGYFLKCADGGVDTVDRKSLPFSPSDALLPYTLSYATADSCVYALEGYWLLTDDSTKRKQHVEMQRMFILLEETPEEPFRMIKSRPFEQLK